MMGISRGDSTQPLQLSPLGEACSRNDLTAVHEILKKTGYKGDEGTENEVGCRLGCVDAHFVLFWVCYPIQAID
jgi:BR-signaling kinase